MGITYSTFETPRLDLGVALEEYVSMENSWVGTQLFPIIEVGKKEATYSAITRESILRREDSERGSGGTYNRVRTEGKDKTYKCLEYGLEGQVEDDKASFFKDDFDYEMALSRKTMRNLLANQEVRVKDTLFDTAVFTGASLFTDLSATPWATSSTDIIGQVIDAVETARKNSGMRPDTILIPASIMPDLLKNTGIKNQFPGANLITVSMIEQALPSIFGINRLIVAGEVENTADEGQSAVVGDIWGSTFVGLYITDTSSDLSNPAIGRTFLWSEDSSSNMVVESYREPQTRSDVIRVRHHVDENLIDKNFGHLLKVA